MHLCTAGWWDLRGKSNALCWIQKPMVVVNPIGYQVCLLCTNLGWVTQCMVSKLTRLCLAGWADGMQTPEADSDTPDAQCYQLSLSSTSHLMALFSIKYPKLSKLKLRHGKSPGTFEIAGCLDLLNIKYNSCSIYLTHSHHLLNHGVQKTLIMEFNKCPWYYLCSFTNAAVILHASHEAQRQYVPRIEELSSQHLFCELNQLKSELLCW